MKQVCTRRSRQRSAKHRNWDLASILLLDESANEKAGTNNAGDSRQFNGQMGKTDICQVGGNVESFQLETGPLPIRTFMDDLLFIPGEWSHT